MHPFDENHSKQESLAGMSRSKIGQQYDEIASSWASYHQTSDYGVAAIERALGFAKRKGTALDVGCGAGGRLIKLLEREGFGITGLDASCKMIDLARKAHPDGDFTAIVIGNWETDQKFDFILAWDSLFHLPYDEQQPVLEKLCAALAADGVLVYSFGDEDGSHSDAWEGQTFHYSSLGVTRNVEILQENALILRHLELDQFPEKHVFVIAQKLQTAG